MQITEQKIEDKYKYTVPIKDGTLEWFCQNKIRTEDTEKDLDNIYQKIMHSPSGEHSFTYKGYKINYNKQIELWLEEDDK